MGGRGLEVVDGKMTGKSLNMWRATVDRTARSMQIIFETPIFTREKSSLSDGISGCVRLALGRNKRPGGGRVPNEVPRYGPLIRLSQRDFGLWTLVKASWFLP